MRLKSSLVAGIAGVVVGALALTGCSSSGSGGGSGTEAKAGAALTIAKPDGAIATESNNPWVGDSSGLKLGYINAILEPLAIVNLVDPSKPTTPWLASDIKWADDYKSVELTARDGVKWNDGQAFSADDIAFTFDLFMKNKDLDTAALGLTGVKADGNKVTLSFENSMFVKQDKVLHKQIVPSTSGRRSPTRPRRPTSSPSAPATTR